MKAWEGVWDDDICGPCGDERGSGWTARCRDGVTTTGFAVEGEVGWRGVCGREFEGVVTARAAVGFGEVMGGAALDPFGVLRVLVR